MELASSRQCWHVEVEAWQALILHLNICAGQSASLNVPVAQGTAEVLPYRSESFDAVVSSYLAKYVDIYEVINECWRVLRPGGVVVFHDFTYPSNLISGLWSRYFALLRLAGRFVTSWKVVFGELDDSS